VALLADAGHNLSDVLGLVVAFVASILVRRAPSSRFTYGLRGTSILAALSARSLQLYNVGITAIKVRHNRFKRAYEPGFSASILPARPISRLRFG
jgi:Co/Zn/Cd efflux system component